MTQQTQLYDAFLSYASEDKRAIAEPLARLLKSVGIKVWFDDFELRVGDSLMNKIAEGLNSSNHGICILSPSFIGKPWPEWELRGMVAQLLAQQSKLLPIWYEVNEEDVRRLNPSLASVYAVKTDGSNLNDVFLAILRTINPAIHASLIRLVAFRNLVAEGEKGLHPIEELRPGPVRHANLSRSVMLRAALVAKTLEETGTAFSTFVDDLRRDIDLEPELQTWEFIALVFVEATRRHNLDIAGKKELLALLFLLSMGGMSSDLFGERRFNLPSEIIEECVQLYSGGIAAAFHPEEVDGSTVAT